MYQYCLFDLDGTLTDSREGITKCVQYALAKCGIEEPDLKKLECFIGPPLHTSITVWIGIWRKEQWNFTGRGSVRSVFLKTRCMKEYRKCCRLCQRPGAAWQ